MDSISKFNGDISVISTERPYIELSAAELETKLSAIAEGTYDHTKDAVEAQYLLCKAKENLKAQSAVAWENRASFGAAVVMVAIVASLFSLPFIIPTTSGSALHIYSIAVFSFAVALSLIFGAKAFISKMKDQDLTSDYLDFLTSCELRKTVRVCLKGNDDIFVQASLNDIRNSLRAIREGRYELGHDLLADEILVERAAELMKLDVEKNYSATLNARLKWIITSALVAQLLVVAASWFLSLTSSIFGPVALGILFLSGISLGWLFVAVKPSHELKEKYAEFLKEIGGKRPVKVFCEC